MELTPILEVQNLAFSYPGRPVLKQMDFKLHEGEVVSLLGPNGCGKSTFIRLMLGLLRGSGDIRLNGKDLSHYSPRQIARQIAYIPQYHSVPFNYTVTEMVLMGRTSTLGFFTQPGRRDRDIAMEALKTVGIEHLASRPFGQLSGGQKQMVLLARALAQEVSTFIMDEPVSGLDYGNQMRLLEMITRLADEGKTFLKTTHYPDHAMLVSSRIVVMNGGHMIDDGAPEAVITPHMLKQVYGVEADILEHRDKYWCIPTLAKGIR
jgi:iron complex transport system ATP-binding protein